MSTGAVGCESTGTMDPRDTYGCAIGVAAPAAHHAAMALITHPQAIPEELTDDAGERSGPVTEGASGLAFAWSPSDREPAPLRPIDRQWFRRFAGRLKGSSDSDLDV